MNNAKKLIVIVILLFSCPVMAKLPDDCSASALSTINDEAKKGNKKAQYILGYQLLAGECREKNIALGLDNLKLSILQNYAPSMHLYGVVGRSNGDFEGALAWFTAAAFQGFRQAEADLAFIHADPASPLYDPAIAWAWFNIALKHQTQEKPKAFLTLSVQRLDKILTPEQRITAKEYSANLSNKIDKVPEFNDHP